MTTALPDYLRHDTERNAPRDFKDCPPGHRFGLYFDGWTANFGIPNEGKSDALRTLADKSNLPAHSREATAALIARQLAHAQADPKHTLIYPTVLTAPLATGLGNEHPLENGFAFLNPYGLPYLAGSGLKGVLRRAAEELADDWGADSAKVVWTDAAIRTLFGPGERDDTRDTDPRQGALAFADVFFAPRSPTRPLLKVEIMTPHHTDYLQGSGTPHANENPNPIPFLAVADGCEANLILTCNPHRIPPDQAELRTTWKALMEAALEHAGQWLGLGAKTAVGYGRFKLHPDVAAKRDAERAQAEQAERDAAEKARLDALPATDQFREKVDALLKAMPKDPRYDTLIKQATSTAHWSAFIDLLDTDANTLADSPKADREALATQIKKSANAHFKIEGKAEKALKTTLARIRGN